MLTVLDWLIIAILIGGLLRGYSVGAVRQVASLVGLVVAFLVSVEFMGMVGNMIVESLKLSESLAPLAGFTTLFLGVYLLFLVISRFLEQVLASLSLSVLDRVAGGAVGGFKAALLLSLLFLALTGIEVPSEKTKKKSTLYRPVAQLLPRTMEAAENWFPAAKRAADELGTRVRAEIRSPTTPSSGKESAMSSTGP
ncbi:MAG: CvpA family protein [Salinibacter sp.]|uniref:CvpA family protein n=1 Tax=Salinibacter sp. TaxID=2065818 RepID=UPI0035D4811F